MPKYMCLMKDIEFENENLNSLTMLSNNMLNIGKIKSIKGI